METLKIMAYRDFWDFPRIFLVRIESGNILLFDCEFSDVTEDFSNVFNVYVISALTDDELSGSWFDLKGKGTKVGEIPISAVKFDETKREFIFQASISQFIK